MPAVACFAPPLHAGMPAAAATYALPPEWRKRCPLRRFGFHGLSHAYASRQAANLLALPLEGMRIVSCHLGAGASLAAVQDGSSVDTTMGFTPLDGLVMATRSGSVDPGLLIWLEEHERLAPREVADTLEHRSGLLGLAGTGDMRELLGVGVGERAAEVRRRTANRLAHLGVRIDDQLNADARPDTDIGAGAAGVRTLVVLSLIHISE